MKLLYKDVWTLFIDGASRNNPGKAGAGVVIKKDQQTIVREGFYLGIKTNNQAEYLALLLGLFFIQQYANAQDNIQINSDSELLVKQFLGQYKVKNEGLKPLHMLAKSIAKVYPVQVTHVLRHDNKEADRLANEGIDKKKPLPQQFIIMLQNNKITF